MIERTISMEITFKYKSTKYVIRKSDFLEQLSAYYKRKYYLQHINMGEYIADIFVSDKNIVDIEYVGTDLIYYKITYKNGTKTTISKEELDYNPDFVEAKIIENDLVVLEMPHYNYLNIISGYSILSQDKTITIDLDKDINLLINKLQKVFRKEINGVINGIDCNIRESVYDGDIEYRVGSKKYRSTDKLVYKSGNYKYAYIPSDKIVIIMNN